MTEATADLPGASLVDDFDDVVRPHVPTLRRLAAVTAVGVDPDDVVQEALLRAWKKRATYRPERGSVRTWLLAVTADQARRLRQRRSGHTWVDLDAAAEAADHTPLPDLDLRRAVMALAPRQRRAVLLYYYVDLSVDDVAKMMNCAPGTVKSTLADARARLANLLGGRDD